MNARVVDTNVLIVANGRNTHASSACQGASLQILKVILDTGRIVVDSAGEIFDEYKTYCNPSGQPGVGDLFFREILQNYTGKVRRIELQKSGDGSFVDFPADPDLANFDPSDRKFAAAARKSGASVVNATDPDWLDHKPALNRNGIQIEFVCSENRTKW
jgi:hypothetical protein